MAGKRMQHFLCSLQITNNSLYLAVKSMYIRNEYKRYFLTAKRI